MRIEDLEGLDFQSGHSFVNALDAVVGALNSAMNTSLQVFLVLVPFFRYHRPSLGLSMFGN